MENKEIINKMELEEVNGITKIKLNGVNLKKVLDYKLEQRSNDIEVMLKISIDKLNVSTDIK